MTQLTNPIAELKSPDSGIIIRPEQAYKIKEKETFFCPDNDCLDKKRILTVVKRENTYFFRHLPKFKHEIRPETLLHKLAIKWFENKSKFEIPYLKTASFKLKRQNVKIDSDKTELEYRKLKTIIPDVKLITSNRFEFAIEVFVTSDISKNKSKLINEFGLPTLRIDLSIFYKNHPEKCRTDYDFIEKHLDGLLNDINLKSWEIYPTQEDIDEKVVFEIIKKKKETEDYSGYIIALILSLVFFIFRKKK